MFEQLAAILTGKVEPEAKAIKQMTLCFPVLGILGAFYCFRYFIPDRIDLLGWLTLLVSLIVCFLALRFWYLAIKRGKRVKVFEWRDD